MTISGRPSQWARAAGEQLRDSWRWARGRREVPAGSVPLAYGRTAMTFLWVITAMTVVETAIVELAVGWLWLRIAMAVVCIGSLPFVAGIVAAYRIRPHLLSERSLLVRCGNALEAEVPLSAIASVGRTLGTAPRRPTVSGSALDLSVGTTDVVIGLAQPQTMTGDDGEPATISSIRCSADDPGAFVRLVNDALHARQPTRWDAAVRDREPAAPPNAPTPAPLRSPAR